MKALQQIEHWRSPPALQVEPAQARLDGEPSSLDHQSDQASFGDAETLELALERMSCASSKTVDSDEQSESDDVDWLQREHDLDPVQIQRREYKEKTRATQDWVWELWCRSVILPGRLLLL